MIDFFVLRESFDSVYRYNIKKDSDGDYSADLVTDDGSKVRIIMYHYKNAWQVGFVRNGSGDVTGEGDAQKILSTVFDFVKKIIKKEKPEVIAFETQGGRTNKKSNTGSRAKLYKRMADRYASQLGYRVSAGKSEYGTATTQFSLVRK